MLNALNKLSLIAMVFALAINPLYAQDHTDHAHHDEHEGDIEHAAHHGHSEHDGNHSDHTQIQPAMAQQVGITTAIAHGGAINRSLTTYGTLRTPPGHVSHVRARFSGLIEEVNAQIGQRVSAGEVLARVESNESLNSYEVTSPVSGVIIARHASVGELTGEQALFIIANFAALWAEVKIFPGQRAHIHTGQKARITAGDLSVTGAVAHVLPSIDDAPFVTARIPITNGEGQWAPGLPVEARIEVETLSVPVRVENRAVQVMDGTSVVFVHEDDSYHSRPVTLGERDDEYTEIKAGLEPGEPYVVNNSYLIKADIEKSGAAHHH